MAKTKARTEASRYCSSQGSYRTSSRNPLTLGACSYEEKRDERCDRAKARFATCMGTPYPEKKRKWYGMEQRPYCRNKTNVGIYCTSDDSKKYRATVLANGRCASKKVRRRRTIIRRRSGGSPTRSR